MVLWVRFTWNEGRGGWEGEKVIICVNNYIAIYDAYFFRFKFQALSLHLLHNAVRGALIFYILKLSTTILRLKVSFLNVSLIFPFHDYSFYETIQSNFLLLICASTTTLKLMMLVSFSYVHENKQVKISCTFTLVDRDFTSTTTLKFKMLTFIFSLLLTKIWVNSYAEVKDFHFD